MGVVFAGVRMEVTHHQQIGDRAGMVRCVGRVTMMTAAVPVLERDVQRHAAGQRDRQQPGRGQGESEEAPGGHEAGILSAPPRQVNRLRLGDRERVLVL
jgi:hypothetical protein